MLNIDLINDLPYQLDIKWIALSLLFLVTYFDSVVNLGAMSHSHSH